MQLPLGFSCLIISGFCHADAVLNRCKCFPGDSCWPTDLQWSHLNQSVSGRLVATVPLGEPCHGNNYNETRCNQLQDEWTYPPIHYESSSSVMAPLFANDSCDPWQPVNRTCTLGNYVDYAVNVSSVADVQAAISFARAYNIRIVIRNTGHDYTGRSTGAGALAIWTHYLKSHQIVSWDDEYYSGPALAFGAGIQGFEALEFSHDAGFAVITGECPSVGIAGGYVQGGGHSALSTKFGLAADNVLSFDVVLPDGTFVIATRHNHAEVYWALSGGGPGNFGVVMAITTKAIPDATISGAKFAIEVPSNNPDLIYNVVDAFHAALPDIVDQGVMIIYYFGKGYLQSPAMTVYNKTKEEAALILQPFIDSIDALGLTISPNYTEYSSYYDHYNHYWGPLPEGNIEVGTLLFGGRLIPRNQLSGFPNTSRAMVDLDVTIIGVGLDVSSFGTNNANSVLPAWRDALVSASLTYAYNFTAPFEDMWALQNKITNTVQPIMDAATPSSGAYMNEADFQQPNFQEAFYGDKYAQLQILKRRYDPDNFFYVPTGVGSESWRVDKSGRMCKA